MRLIRGETSSFAFTCIAISVNLYLDSRVAIIDKVVARPKKWSGHLYLCMSKNMLDSEEGMSEIEKAILVKMYADNSITIF